MKYTHFVSVAALVVNESNEILLIKHPRRGWEYPGGMVEPGETLQEALRREIREESGVEVELVGLSGICKNVERDIVNIDFVCSYRGGQLKTSEESLEVQWFTIEEAMKQITEPLTQIRLSHMISGRDEVSCFGFKKDPFELMEERALKVGMKEDYKKRL